MTIKVGSISHIATKIGSEEDHDRIKKCHDIGEISVYLVETKKPAARIIILINGLENDSHPTEIIVFFVVAMQGIEPRTLRI